MAKNRIVLLENFNNYFNRKVLYGISTLDDYTSLSTAYEIFDTINFNPNDNVSTEIILNYFKTDLSPNYCLVLEDASTTLVSRWYVIETSRTRNGQYKLKLKRDLLVDYFTSIQNAPIYIHRAYIDDTDPFIFNSEGMSFNQIKSGETLLKDKTKMAWIIAYISSSATGTITAPLISGQNTYLTLADISNATGITQATLSSMINTDGQTTNSKNVYSNNKFKNIF